MRRGVLVFLLVHPSSHSLCSPSGCTRALCSLKDIYYSDKQLYLVFEWVDKDLKKYMDSVPAGMGMPLIKARTATVLPVSLLAAPSAVHLHAVVAPGC
jgi:hypothetical protein